MDKIKKFLEENSDEKKADFDNGLINTKYKILGINIKKIEDFAKKLLKEGQSPQFIHILSHEEVLLSGFMIAFSRESAKEKVEKLKKLLPFIDNWGSCDSIVVRLKNMESEKDFFVKLLSHEDPFYKRVGIVWLKRFMLKSNLHETISLLERVNSDNYYVKMALAWTYQEALTFDYEYMFAFLRKMKDDFVKNKTISKACDSFRMTKQQKEKLKELRGK